MDEVLEKLKNGIRKFRAEVHGPNAAAYRKAASEPQKPHTLLIACADSRVDVEAITSSGPGAVFVTRNVGNMVPPYGPNTGAVSAVIEYAVTALKVRHIAICGHSDCGAMKALLTPGAAAQMPTVGRWLSNGEAALSVAPIRQQQDGRELLPVMTEQNVLLQLAHLKTHPSVAGAIARGQMTVSGWVFDISSGEVRIMEGADERFVTVTDAKTGTAT
jgi:carbonic anhydrase